LENFPPPELLDEATEEVEEKEEETQDEA